MNTLGIYCFLLLPSFCLPATSYNGGIGEVHSILLLAESKQQQRLSDMPSSSVEHLNSLAKKLLSDITNSDKSYKMLEALTVKLTSELSTLKPQLIELQRLQLQGQQSLLRAELIATQQGERFVRLSAFSTLQAEQMKIAESNLDNAADDLRTFNRKVWVERVVWGVGILILILLLMVK